MLKLIRCERTGFLRIVSVRLACIGQWDAVDVFYKFVQSIVI